MRRFFLFILIMLSFFVFAYKLRVGDVISIEVFNQPQLSRTVKVSLDGTIPYPFAGNIYVEGKTPEEVAKLLEPYAQKIVRDAFINVWVEQYAPMYVYIQGAINKVADISQTPGITLTKLLAQLGVGPSNSGDSESNVDLFDAIDFGNVVINRNGNITKLNLWPFFYQGDFSKDVELKENDIIFLPPMTVDKNIQVNGVYTYTANYQEGLTLSVLLSYIGPLDKEIAELENAKLFINNKMLSINLEKVISGEEDYNLKPGARLYIPKRREKYAYIIGLVNNPGYKTFSSDEPITLKLLLAKAGGIQKNMEEWVKDIKVTQNGQEKIYSNTILFEDNTVPLKRGAIVEVVSYQKFRVYVTGDIAKGIIEFLPKEPRTFKTLISKIGGISTEQMKWIKSIKIIRDSTDITVDLSKFDEVDYQLLDGDTVEIKKYPEFYVYIQGFSNRKGKIIFEPDEKHSLKILLSKVGLPDEEIENEGIALINNNVRIPVKEVLYGNKDYLLSKADIVQILYEPFSVTVIGPAKNGKIKISYKDPRTLGYLIKSLGISKPELIESVLLVRKGSTKKYGIQDLISGKVNETLMKNDTVIIKSAVTRAVYLTGDVAKYIRFEYDEPISLQRILAKSGINDYRKIEKITLNGKVIPYDTDVDIENGSVLNISLKRPINVTVMGYVKNTGNVKFDYYETADLKNLFGKLGGLILDKTSYYTSEKVYVFRKDKTYEFDAEKVYKGEINFDLQDNDFVYVTQREPNYVYVFGEGIQNRVVRFNYGETFDMKTLIGKIGGIPEGISKEIMILNGSTETIYTWDERKNIQLERGSVVVFNKDYKNYVYVIDASGKPQSIYLDRKETTLYDVLTRINVNKSYKKVMIRSSGNVQEIDVTDFSKTLGIVVKPGDVITVLNIPQNYAYVLGEVNRPGLVEINEGTTVLEAILKAGAFTTKAIPSSIYLYRGGPQGTPIKINLSGALSGKVVKDNPIVETGDVIFVPNDPFKTALEWVPTITALINLYNNISGLFK
ncbi:SLBB domain-containing protein [Thermosipho ferrireducens]|uniref:SLBB domain-containing protein n=1 Tax=Thermosipho ferrireducens TaxID=2571116 RepID=A0ABX7S9Q5_9BACT|nr:SLBB domain-containing protein [Thermosipho ferrireducens]QTA38447.1 SLBB domain-containing protein [Thermosipho ferrireducens]